MGDKKIFIVGSDNIDKLSLADTLIEKNDDLSIGSHFTNDKEYEGSVNDNYIYYLSTQDIDLTYKNNFILFINTNNYISEGITLDTFYNNDIFIMSPQDFNNISGNIFKESYDILIVWLYTNYSKCNDKLNKDIIESRFLEQRLQDEKLKYIYFFNEENDFISNVILEYIDCDDPERKNQILLENN